MGLSKQLMDKIEQKCGKDEPMLGYMRDTVMYEFQDQAHYKKDYETRIRKYAKEKGAEK